MMERLPTLRKTGLCLAVLCLLSGPAASNSEDTLNAMIGGSGETEATEQNVAPATPSAPTTPKTPENTTEESGLAGGQRLGTHAEALNHIQLLSGRPLPNESCRDVIFEARPSLKKRHNLSAGNTMKIGIKDLCLIGFRNDASDRTLVVRLGEAVETLAIVLDPKLFTGYAIAPGQQITVPLRQLAVPDIDISVEVAWEKDLKSADPKVGRTTLTLTRNQ